MKTIILDIPEKSRLFPFYNSIIGLSGTHHQSTREFTFDTDIIHPLDHSIKLKRYGFCSQIKIKYIEE